MMKGPYKEYNDDNISSYYYEGVGKHLKSTSGWYDNGNGTNDFGLNIQPRGNGYSTAYWGGERQQYLWHFSSQNNKVYYNRAYAGYDEEIYAPIRCVKD